MTDKTRTADYTLAIVGAGAAGLGASEQAAALGIDHVVLEAAHRVGGRGLTEYLEGRIPVDLGCHWMHSASRNPYVKWAERLGFGYDRGGYHFRMHFHGKWLDDAEQADYLEFLDRCEENAASLYRTRPGASLMDAIDPDSKWAPHAYYWVSLMHSNDADQVSLQDPAQDQDTDEDWPVREGYGALITRQGADCPVRLNTRVRRIDRGGSPVKLVTGGGTLSADKVIVTVSTGVLGGGAIRFDPVLPGDTRDAIQALPLGNSNYQFFSLAPGALADAPKNLHYQDGETAMAIRIRPFDTDCVFTSTGGRFAWWLEKQGPAASREYFREALVKVFGADVTRRLREFKVSAWGYDPFIRGAYSSQAPGWRDMRTKLAAPVDECLYFAGEATNTEFINTAHGAYLSGKRAVMQALGESNRAGR